METAMKKLNVNLGKVIALAIFTVVLVSMCVTSVGATDVALAAESAEIGAPSSYLGSLILAGVFIANSVILYVAFVSKAHRIAAKV